MRASEVETAYREHADALFAFLVYRGADSHRAEDLLADTFERALRHRRRFDPARGSARAWLFAIALNGLRDDARRRGAARAAGEHLAGTVEAPRDPSPQIVDRLALVDALATLPADERDALALRYGGELTMPEIATLLDLPLTTVDGRVRRGLSRLREHLG